MVAPTVAEEWRPVVGFETTYSVSSVGRVRIDVTRPHTRFVAGYILQPHTNFRGYLFVKLTDDRKRQKTKYVARLVADAFVTKPDGSYAVNHLNGDKQDNRPCNLEWTTTAENTRHAWRTGLCVPMAGTRNGQHKINDDIVRLIRMAHGTDAEVGEAHGVSRSLAGQVRTRKRWAHVPDQPTEALAAVVREVAAQGLRVTHTIVPTPPEEVRRIVMECGA